MVVEKFLQHPSHKITRERLLSTTWEHKNQL
ncbi:hypothetical protein F383_17694 [Gossypium arboreum]|uniref:Uncharacterized protein n=1 Tax=Gossypium arboreum TaxID=29729 RepID=A0A0B0NKX8_GOSAR|nr:hypothetical protein F383_17694 [Gossypium arboreum]